MERTGERLVLTLDAPGQMHVEMSVSSGVSCTLAQILGGGGEGREGSQYHTWMGAHGLGLDRGREATCMRDLAARGKIGREGGRQVRAGMKGRR